jgi:hypothetical protein
MAERVPLTVDSFEILKVGNQQFLDFVGLQMSNEVPPDIPRQLPQPITTLSCFSSTSST